MVCRHGWDGGGRKISERRRKRKAVEEGSEKLGWEVAVMYSWLRRLWG